MFVTKLGAAGLTAAFFFASGLNAGTVGTISACYACAANYTAGTFAPGVDLSDGVGFALTNSSATDITNGIFSIMVGGDNAAADSFNVGTIAALSTIYVIPGLSTDGASGHTFFALLGGARDTSDVGPNSDSVPFEFTGKQGAITVDTGIFTPGPTAGPSNDAALPHANFLGGPDGNDDCNDCFGPKVVATISTPVVGAVPEPGTVIPFLSGLGTIFYVRRKRS